MSRQARARARKNSAGAQASSRGRTALMASNAIELKDEVA